MAGIYGPSVAEGAPALITGLDAQGSNYYIDRDEGDRAKYISPASKKNNNFKEIMNAHYIKNFLYTLIYF